MSKQQSQTPDEPEISNKSPPKKRKGKYELWQRYDPNEDNQWIRIFGKEWRRIRKYETQELAEYNMEKYKRSWGKDWQFEIRVKE